MRVFITGMCGTLGSALARHHTSQDDEVFGCTRSEANASKWDSKYGKLYIGDAINFGDPTFCPSELGRSLALVDRVYHCAAMKHVELCEQNPHEAMVQNVTLTEHLALACKDTGAQFIFISSDKACVPQNVYGATKLIAERVVRQCGGGSVRLGNLVGSSGSVFAKWRDAIAKKEKIKLTDPDMTRYFISVSHAVAFISQSYKPGMVRFPSDMKSARIGDVVCGMGVSFNYVEAIGYRDGETQHQFITPKHCSSDAERWDIKELLAEAGVKQ